MTAPRARRVIVLASAPANLHAAYQAALAADLVPPVSALLQAAMRSALADAGQEVPPPPPPTRTDAATAARWKKSSSTP